jgi:hypothetical protein
LAATVRRARCDATATFGAGVLTTGGCDGATAGARLGDVGDTCVAGGVDACVCDCAEGAGSGDGAGVLAGARCGLGPAAYAGVVISAAETATIAAVRLNLGHRAMTHGNGRC